MNNFLSQKLFKSIYSLVVVFLYFSILEVYSQPPYSRVFKHIYETDSIVKHSTRVKSTLSNLIKFREDLENVDNFQILDKDSISQADEIFKKAILKADAGDVKIAQELENAAIRKYQFIAKNDLYNSFLINVKSELIANRKKINAKKYSESNKELIKIESSIEQFSVSSTTYASFLEDINARIKILFESIGIEQVFPNYLIMADFIITLDLKQCKFGVDYIHKSFQVSGIGRIRFCCDQSCKYFKPINLKDITDLNTIGKVNSFDFKVVKKIKFPEKEILVDDARMIDPSARVGSKVTMELLIQGDSLQEIIHAKENIINSLKLPYADGILLEFDKLKVVSTRMKNISLVSDGFAFYSIHLPSHLKPITINLPTNFNITFDSLILSPDSCWIRAKLFLPKSLTRGDNCDASSLFLGLINIKRNCEFYKVLPGNSFGPMEIGTTTMNISGNGYVADFSSTKSYTSVTPDAKWKGVILFYGKTLGTPDPIESNIGYLKANYNFTNALVTSSGLKATFSLMGAYEYKTLQPSGYDIQFNTAQVNIDSSEVSGGYLQNGLISLPKTAVFEIAGTQIKVNFTNLQIYRNRNIFGSVNSPSLLCWGELTTEGLKAYATAMNVNKPGFVYFSGQLCPVYLPVSGSSFNERILSDSYHFVDSIGLCGVTFNSPSALAIYTPDIPDPSQPLVFIRLIDSWINILTNGVNACIKGSGPAQTTMLGPVSSPQYVSRGNPFTLLGLSDLSYTHKVPDKGPNLLMNFVESAVFTSDLKGYIKLDGPSKINLAFKEMLFTSTAQNAGGKVDLSTPDTLDYWGVALVQKPEFSNGGLICVKTGQIILSASGLAEKRHYTQPFYLTWGEMLATGDMGRLFFDYNVSGQQFDGFNFVPFTIALSKYDTINRPEGFLKAAGEVHFPFFGPDYLNINNWKNKDSTANPYNGRRIELSFDNEYNTQPSITKIAGNWGDNFGNFHYTIVYSASDQDGFIGKGNAGLQYIPGPDIASTIVLKSIGQCISLKDTVITNHTFALGPVANFGITNNLWGCACIINDQIKELVLGGEISTDLNVSVALRSAGSLTFTFLLSPTVSQLILDGTAYLSLAASFDIEANGHFYLKIDRGNDFLEGEISALFKVSTIGESPLTANGDVNWHLGGAANDFQQSLQGILSLDLLGISAQGGFYVGYNAPKAKAWVLLGSDPRYRLNTNAMPDYLTGAYGFVQYGKGFDFFLFSGGFDVFAGAGVFFLSPQQVADLGAVPSEISIPIVPYLVGNLGGSIHGEILAGFVSASASIDLQIIAPYPGSFEGNVTLEGCVLWVACKSVSLTVGLNTSDGLYIE